MHNFSVGTEGVRRLLATIDPHKAPRPDADGNCNRNIPSTHACLFCYSTARTRPN
ncbi:hypothetical protein DPMN_093900 [Dreissena polymorpha]|uniref:Uncharacterized protein n=1 Tax=Dreissena polymorpha TaxID=45954 RepID=A0A9D4L523_DREPO|nr:hypothetical protein DPMN_093900 [Dreissena polymorpha]